MPKNYDILMNRHYLNETPVIKAGSMIEVGKIVGKRNNLSIPIYYYSDSYEECNNHFGVGRFDDGEYYIFFDTYYGKEEFYLSFFNKKEQRIWSSLLMHEVGHIVNKDLEKDYETSEKIFLLREQNIKKGIVMEEEAKADQFAVKEMGKNAVLEPLKYCYKKRQQRTNDHPYAKIMALKEFDNRMKLIKKQ